MCVHFLNFEICELTTPRKVGCCTVTEHKRDIEDVSCGP